MNAPARFDPAGRDCCPCSPGPGADDLNGVGPRDDDRVWGSRGHLELPDGKAHRREARRAEKEKRRGGSGGDGGCDLDDIAPLPSGAPVFQDAASGDGDWSFPSLCARTREPLASPEEAWARPGVRPHLRSHCLIEPTGLGSLQEALRLLTAHYPEFLHKCYFYRPGLAFRVAFAVFR